MGSSSRQMLETVQKASNKQLQQECKLDPVLSSVDTYECFGSDQAVRHASATTEFVAAGLLRSETCNDFASRFSDLPTSLP